MSSEQKSVIDYVELPASDMKAYGRMKEFYTGVFGWKYQEWGPDYSDTHDSGIASGITAGTDHNSRHPLPVVHVRNVEEAKAAVVKAGGVVTRDVFVFPGGRRFHFTDPGGNELAVWSEE